MSKGKTNGAKALIDTLTNAGIDTCFTNPGTSEMHFVAALDNSEMKAVLTLFEGVARTYMVSLVKTYMQEYVFTPLKF